MSAKATSYDAGTPSCQRAKIMQRRPFLLATLSAAAHGLSAAAWAARPETDPRAQIFELEKTVRGRLGVQVLDTGSGRRWQHRGDERFLMCSSFKLLLAAQVLSRVAAGEEALASRVAFGRDALLPNSPVSQRALAQGAMSVGALCEATVTESDNTAAMLLLARSGGPAGLTAWLRGLGDPATRLDRGEPQLNARDPGGELDTSTPAAMARTVARLTVGTQVLPERERAQLVRWMEACRTGRARLRAGLPAGWMLGHKTGTSGRGEWIDIARVNPPGRAPVIVAAFVADSPVDMAAGEAALAAVGRLLPALLGAAT